jgi:hypothetical protein
MAIPRVEALAVLVLSISVAMLWFRLTRLESLWRQGEAYLDRLDALERQMTEKGEAKDG